MTRIRTLSAVAIAAAALGLIAAHQATDNKPSAPRPPAQQPPKPGQQTPKPPEMSPEQQREMQDAMPSAIHQHMNGCVGEYTTKTVFTGPGEEREESTGASKLHMGLDGRFLVQEDAGMMMGQPYKTMKISGYNNGSREFESVWMYTMSTGMLRMTGSSSDNGKTINWKGTYKDREGEQTILVTTTHIDADHFVERLTHGGDEGGVMETTFTRKK